VLAAGDLLPWVVHMSVQRRAIRTAELCLAACDLSWIPVRRSWRYAELPPDDRPRGESLRDVTTRLLPYWYDAIIPDLRAMASVLVVSHGNTLRALVKHLDRLNAEDVTELNVPTGTPLLYELGPDLRPLKPVGVLGGR
jgi:2,3-bisphosphoglycerate-dependent phosphoglycerate mutase